MTTRFVTILSMITALSLSISSCEDFVTVPSPGTQLGQEVVFEDDATALAAMISVYYKLSNANTPSFADGNLNSVTLFEGLYADELTSFIPATSASPQADFYFNNVTPLNQIVSENWGNLYKIIYECNRILEGVNASGNLSKELKTQFTGEAKFIRAFCHFYLVNLHGDVPLITTSDYTANATVSRVPAAQVYQQIIADLLQAKELLSDSYPSEGRVRVNKSAATGMLARVYLYTEDYGNAEVQATEVISKTSHYKLLTNLNEVFLKNSEEAIWQLLPGGGILNYTNEGALFILRAPPTRLALRNELYEAFETDDVRKTDWIDSVTSTSGLTKWHFAHKYKENTANATGAEYSMVLRLAEQYLIRAEARAQQDKLTGDNSAKSDINIIRARAGLGNTTATSKDDLLTRIEYERRVELFTEWGHRFFDLKRTERLDEALDPLKSNWEDTDTLLPIPQSEILLNANLKPQNPGY